MAVKKTQMIMGFYGGVLLLFSCSHQPAKEIKSVQLWDSTSVITQPYMLRWENQPVMVNGQLVKESESYRHLMKTYPYWIEKGSWYDQRRITILSGKVFYKAGEAIPVAHIMEDIQTDRNVYSMGPKKITGEYMNDRLVSPPVPNGEMPWTDGILDGETPPAPWVDYNFEITEYHFSKPGTYRIQWKMGKYASNVLVLTVE